MIKGKITSLQNRLTDVFTSVVNAARQTRSIKSNCYSFSYATSWTSVIGKEWMVAIPSIKDPELYTISHMRKKTLRTPYGESSSTHNRKVVNPQSEEKWEETAKLFSFSEAMIELRKFEDKINAETQHSKTVNVMNYRLCG